MLRIENVMCIAVIIFCLLAIIGEIPWLVNEFKKLYKMNETNDDKKLNYKVFACSSKDYHCGPPLYESNNREKAFAVAREYAILREFVKVSSYIENQIIQETIVVDKRI